MFGACPLLAAGLASELRGNALRVTCEEEMLYVVYEGV